MNIYFSGIGGVGIGPLAEIAHEAGYEVTGSDIEDGLMTRQLREKGITVNIGQDGTFLSKCHHQKAIDWFVYTAALPVDHPELMLAKKLGIKTSQRDELINEIINQKKLKLIAVAGTHGKTTTVGMLVWTFERLGIAVSYLVGTTIKFGPSGHFDPKSEYFIYECDEYNKNFLHYKPYLSLITSLDYDHPDTFPTVGDYKSAFREFCKNSDFVIGWSDQLPEIYDGLPNARILKPDTINNNLRLIGECNRRNSALAQIAIKELGITDSTDAALNDFPGTDRRFEKLAENLYSDYAHHPVEIAATLQMAREISDHIVLVYQPHQNTRQHRIKNEYTNQFELADEIYWLPTYLSREDPSLPIINPSELIKNITNKNNIHITDFSDELWDTIQSKRSSGNLVICMGAGKIDTWVRQKLSESEK